MFVLLIVMCYGLEKYPEQGDSPQPVLYNTLTYNKFTNCLVAFGGTQDFGYQSNEIWKFNLTSEVWSLLVPQSQISPRNYYAAPRASPASFDIDSTSKVCYFGGTNRYGSLNDIWCFDLRDNIVTYM